MTGESIGPPTPWASRMVARADAAPVMRKVMGDVYIAFAAKRGDDGGVASLAPRICKFRVMAGRRPGHPRFWALAKAEAAP